MTAPLDFSGPTSTFDLASTVILRGADGMTASVLTYGARLIDLRMPDGRPLVLSFETLEELEADDASINIPVGRVANRIREGVATLYPDMYDATLELNEKNVDGVALNHLHGGSYSWNKRLYAVKHRAENSVTLARLSPDGEQGHPSDVDVQVTYSLTGDGALAVRFSTTNSGNRVTQTNMTLHPYFDLTGRNGTVENSVIPYVAHAPACTKYLELDPAYNTPTGEVAAVSGTRFDFTTERPLGDACDPGSFLGYDQFLVARETATVPGLTAEETLLSVTGPPGEWGAAVRLDVATNQPGLQIYTAGGMNGDNARGFAKFGSIAVEPSEFVDAGNHANFPQVTLEPGQERVQTITYRFTVV